MLNWLFKKVVKLREKVAVDLGRDDEEKPFLDHLEDLRKMIVRMCVTLLVVVLFTFMFCKELLVIIKQPLIIAGLQDKISLVTMKVTGGFMTAMNISLVAGIIIAFPLLLFFLLQFVLPGLRSNEKKVIFPALAVGAGLFAGGVLFAYTLVAPRALKFFYEFGVDFINSDKVVEPGSAPPIYPWELVEYVKFICQFVLIFGACFELPVVVMALVKMDVLNYKVMKTSRSWAAIIICVVAAAITPTQDAMTLSLLAVPMYALYEICIWLAYFIEKKDRQQYPEYYKDQDQDAAKIEVADDWDNENYNPWHEDGRDEEDENKSSAAKVEPTPSEPQSENPTPPASPHLSEEPVEKKEDLPLNTVEFHEIDPAEPDDREPHEKPNTD